jgi:gliding motility-associated-like protein
MQPFTLNQFKYLMKRIVSLNKYIPLLFLFALALMQEANGQAFTQQPENALICQGENVTFSVVFTGGIGTAYQWRIDDRLGGGFVNVTNGAVYSGATTNTLTLTNPPLGFNNYQYRCIANYIAGIGGDPASVTSNTVTFNIDQLPNPLITINGNLGSNQLCGTDIDLSGSDFVIQTNSSITGLWEFTAGSGSFAPNNDETTTATLNKGVNTITWKVTNGVCATQTSPSVDITSDRNPDAADAGTAQAFCDIDNTTLNATVPKIGDKILWTGAAFSGLGTVTNVNSATSAVTSLGYGDNVFELVILSEYEICDPSDASYVTITRDEPPTPSIVQSNQTLCLSAAANTIDLDGGKLPGTATGQWTVSTATPTTSSNASETFTDLDQGDNIFNWTLSNGTCVGDPSYATSVTITRDILPDAANAGNDKAVCAVDNSTLNATVPKAGDGILWTATATAGAGAVTNVNSATSAVTGLGFGDNTFELVIQSKYAVCANSAPDYVIITRDRAPAAAVVNSIGDINSLTENGTLNICTENFGVIAGTIADGFTNGQWTLDGVTTFFDSPTISSANVENYAPLNTTKLLVWTTKVAGSSCASDSWEISLIHKTTTQPTITGGDNLQTCGQTYGASATLAGLAGETVLWTIDPLLNGESFTTPNAATATAQNLVVGDTYTLLYTITNTAGCTVSDDAQLEVLQDLTEPLAGDDQNVCSSTATLAANAVDAGNSETGTWTVESGAANVTNINDPNSGVTGLVQGASATLRWTISNGVCTPDEFDEVTITYDEAPTVAAAGGDENICGATANLAGNAPGIGTGLWTKRSGPGNVVAGQAAIPTASVENLNSTTPTVFRWTISNGSCPDSFDEVTLTAFDNVTTADAGAPESICVDNTTLAGNAFDAGNGELGTWTITNAATGAITDENNPTSTLTGLVQGEVVNLTWTIDNGVCPIRADNTTVTYDEAPTVAAAGGDQNICGATANLAGNTADVGTGLWTKTSGPGNVVAGQTANPIASVENLNSTTPTLFKWTISNGSCPATEDEVQLTSFDDVTEADAGTDQNICVDNTSLAGNPVNVGNGELGAWTLVSGVGNITTPASPTSGVTGLVQGTTAVFRWTIDNTICPVDADEVSIIYDAAPTVSAAGGDFSVCTGGGNLAANTPVVGIGTWSVLSGSGNVVAGDENNEAAAIENLVNGSPTTFRWTIANGTCTPSTDDVTVTRTGDLTEAEAGTDQNICVDNATLAGNAVDLGNGEVGTWTISNGGTATITSPNDPATTVTGLVQGAVVEFTWTIDNTICPPDADAVTVTYDNAPTLAAAGGAFSVCTSTGDLAGNAPVVGTGTWSVLSGSGNVVAGDENNEAAAIENLVNGSPTTFRWTIANGTCTASTDDVIVTRTGDLTEADAGTDQNICIDNATLAGNAVDLGNGEVGTWTITNGGTATITSPNDPATTVTGLVQGAVVEFTWTIDNTICPPDGDAVTVTYDNAPTVAAAGGAFSVCTSTGDLAANAATTGIGTWTVVNGSGNVVAGDENNEAAAIENLVNGSPTTFRWTIANGTCTPSTDDVTVTRTGDLTEADAGTDQNICIDNATLAGNAVDLGNGEVGTWTITNGGTATITSPNDPATTVTGLVQGAVVEFTWTIDNTICPPDADAVTFTYENNFAIAPGATDDICANAYELSAYEPDVANGETTIWDIDFDGADITGDAGTFLAGTLNDKDITLNTTTVGTYTATWSVTNACGSQTQVFVINKYATVSAALAGPDQEVCVDNTIMAATPVQAGETGTWTRVSPGTAFIAIGDKNDPNAPVTNLTQGQTVTFDWSVTNPSDECGTTSQEMTIFYSNDVSNAPISAGSNQNICVNITLLSGTQPTYSNGESGIWTVESAPDGVVFTDDTLYNTFVTLGGTAGNYQLKWTITNACGSESNTVDIFRFSDNINVTNSAETGDSITICTTAYELNGNDPLEGDGIWEYVSGPGNIVAGEENLTNARVENITEAQPTIVKWVLRKGTCAEDSEEFKITKSGDITTPQVGGDQEICTDTTRLEVTNGVLPEGENGFWTVTNSPVGSPPVVFTPNDTAFNPLVSNLVFGTYQFTWTISNGVCPDAAATVNVTYYETPANAIADLLLRDTLTMCDDEVLLTLDANEPVVSGATGLWTNADGITFDDDDNAKSSITGPILQGDYILTWTLTNGVCSSTPGNVVLSVLQALTEPTATAPAEICADSVQLTGNAIDTLNNEVGTWIVTSLNDVSGVVFEPSENDPNAIAKNITFGSHTFTWIISNNDACTSKKASAITNYLETPGQGDAGTDIEICLVDASPQLNATPLVLPNQGTWSDVSGTLTFTDDLLGTIPNANNEVAFVQNWAVGTYQIIWSAANGSCPAPNDTVLLTVFDSPDVADADEPNNTITEICLNETLDLDAVAPNANKGTGVWTSDDAANTVFSNANFDTTQVSFLAAGNYKLTWTITNGPCVAASDSIDITVNPLPVTPNAGENDTICADEYIGQLAGNDPQGYAAAWVQAIEDTDVVTITPTGALTADLTNIGYGDHHLIWEITTATCGVLRDTVIIRRSEDPLTDSNGDFAGPDQELCYNETNFAGELLSGTGTWSKDDVGAAGIIVDVNNPTSLVSGLDRGITAFNWTVSNEACGPYVDQVLIMVNDYPEPDAANNDEYNYIEFCEVFEFDLYATKPFPTSLTPLWRVISPSTHTVVFDDNTLYNTHVSGLGYGLTRIGWSLDNGECLVEDTLEVMVYHAPTIANIDVDDVTTCDTMYQFNADPPDYGNGLWTKDFGPAGFIIEKPTNPATKMLNLAPGFYQFRWTIRNGNCPASKDTVTLTVKEVPISDAGKDASLCEDVTTSIDMYANTPVVGQTGKWTKLLGTGIIGNNTDPETEVTNLSFGANIFVWTLDNGTCATPDTIVVTLYDSPSNAVVGANKETCESTETLFAGNVTIGQGKWTLQSGQGIISNAFSKTPTVSDLGIGVNEFAWTVSSGPCTPTAAVQTIIRYAKPESIELGSGLFICADTLQLNTDATTAGIGTWEMVTGVGAFDDVNDETTTVRGLQDGLSRISWTINTVECGFTADTLVVEVQPRTTVPQTMADFIVCESNATIRANEILQGVGHWELRNTSAVIADENNDTTEVSNLIFGDNIFVWVAENAPCAVMYDTLIVTRLIPPLTADAGDDQAICDDNTIMDGTNDTSAVGVWTLVTGFGTFTDASLYNTAVTDIPNGYHTYAWTLSKGDCPITSDTVEVFVNERTSPVYAGVDQESCQDSALIMATLVTQGVGHWEKVNTTATIADANNDTTMVYNLAYGDNHLVWVVENAPCETIRDTVILTRSQPVEMANAGPDQQLCETNTIIAADEVFIGAGHWEVLQGGGTLGNDQDFSTTITGLSRVQDNILVWKVENASCATSVDTLIVVVDQIPTTADAGANETVCSTSYNLDGNEPAIGNGTWRLVSGSGTFVDSIDAKTQVTNLTPGANEFSWCITNGTCDSTFATVIITRDEEPSAAIVEDDFNVCDTVAVINAMQPLVGDGIWVAFSPGRTIDDNTALTSGVNNLLFGSNRFGWIVRNGICPIKTAIVDVFRNLPADTAMAGDDIEVCGTEVMLNAQPLAIGEGYWIDPAGNATFDDATLINATASNLANNINQLIWSSTNGACIGNSDTVQVTSLPIPIIDLGDDIILCDTLEINLTASTLNATETGTWRLISGAGIIDNVNNKNITITGLGFGENSFEWYVENTIGCNNSDTITITVFDLPSAANINVVDDVCETNVLSINAEDPLVGAGSWSTTTNGLTFDDNTSASTSITLTTYGAQELTYTIVNGSCPANIATTVFNRFETPSIAEVMNNDTICGKDLALTATPPVVGTGNWTLTSGFGSLDNANSPNAHARNIGDGANVFNYTITNGLCPSTTAQVTIVKLKDLTIPNIITTNDICVDNFELIANEPGVGETGFWSVIAGAVVITDPDQATTIASALSPEVMEVAWTINNAKCELSASQTFNFYGTTPEADAGADLLLCNTEGMLSAISPSKGTGTWDVLTGQGLFDDDNDPITQISALYAGITSLTWTVTLGTCPVNVDTMLLRYELGPEIILSDIFETRAGVAVQLVAQVDDAIDITWTPPAGLTNPKAEITAATVFETTSYTITAFDQNGCQASETTTVLISDLDPDEIVQINLFSPNGDGVNDYWTINQESMALGCQVHIYDRYGVMVFQASNYANEWNGTKGGEQLPEGTYYYAIACGNNAPQQGAITLLR